MRVLESVGHVLEARRAEPAGAGGDLPIWSRCMTVGADRAPTPVIVESDEPDQKRPHFRLLGSAAEI